MFGHIPGTDKSKNGSEAASCRLPFTHFGGYNYGNRAAERAREHDMTNDKINSKASPKVRTALTLLYALPVLFVLCLCAYLLWVRASHQPPPVRPISSQPFASEPIGGLTANLFTQGEQLHASGNDVFIEFRNGQSNLVDVGEVTFELELKMPDLVMHCMGKVLPTATPGQYRTTIVPQMAGEWTATVGYSGPRGTAKAHFTETIK